MKLHEFLDVSGLGFMLLLPLFLQTAVGLHCSLPLLLHHSLSGHGRLVCGGHAVTQERVKEQRPRILLDDRQRSKDTVKLLIMH